MSKQKIDTILFDFDGTIVNTIPLIVRSFEDTLAHFLPDETFDTEAIHRFIGPTLKQTFGELNPKQATEMIDYYRGINRKYHDELVTLYPDVKEDLDKLKEAGLSMGIVSSKQRDVIDLSIDYFGLTNYFKVIVASNDVTFPKPHPEPLELAMKQMKKTAKQVIYVGDTSHDIHCGLNTGVLTAGVAWSFRGAQYLKDQGANYILNRLNDLLTIIKEVS